MTTKYETIEIGKFRKTPDGNGGTQPFCIAFVHSNKGNFVLKGMNAEVQTYIEQKFPFCFYKKTYWQDGKSRGGFWRAPSQLNLFFIPKRCEKKKRILWFVSMKTTEGWKDHFMSFRKMPSQWLPVFSQATCRS